jgi:hypothetical protein
LGFLSAYAGTVRVKVGLDADDYYVDLKKFITQGDQERAEAALVRTTTNAKGEVQVEPDVASYRKFMVLAAIDSWNLDDDNQAVLLVTEDNVSKLPMPVFNALWEQVQKNNSEAARTSEEQLDFRK